MTEYRDKLFRALEHQIVEKTTPERCVSTAPTMASTGEQVSREVVIGRQKTRGLHKEHHIPIEEVEVEGARRKRKVEST